MTDYLAPETIVDTAYPTLFGSNLASTYAQTQGVLSQSDVYGYSPTTIKDTTIPQPVIASDLTSSTLDTSTKQILDTFNFGQVGAIQIGVYQATISGMIKISPNGIVGISKDTGSSSFTLDGTTGNATFRGTVTAGSLISGTIVVGGSGNASGIIQIKDSSGNTIIQGDNAGHHYYDTSAHELVKIDTVGFHAYDTSAHELMRVTAAGLLLKDTSGVINIGQVSNGMVMGNTKILAWYKNDNSTLGASIDYTSGHLMRVANLFGDIDMQPSGSFKINGSAKTAIVPTSNGYKALYCIESPDVWFMDFFENVIDPAFLEVTEKPYHTVICADGYTQIWGKRKGYAQERFTEKTKEQFEHNNAFWNTPNNKN